MTLHRPARLLSNRRLQILAIGFFALTGATFGQGPAPVLSIDQIGAGEMLMQTDEGLVPLPIVDIDVDLSVTGIMLRGRIAQTFTNPTADTIEATYVFPLPSEAALHHMHIEIGSRRIVATVQETHQARRTYEVARSQGRTAALVRQDFGNLFTTKAANIGPGESIRVVLEYLEEVDWVDNAFELRFPLTYVPRFTPPPSAGSRGLVQLAGGVRDASRNASGPFLPNASIHVTLDPGLPIDVVTSQSHGIRTERSTSILQITTDPGTVVADRDFTLRWSPQATPSPKARVLFEDREDGRYGVAMILPPAPDGDVGRGLATETLFIIDVSGSMSGPPLRQAREALLEALGRLRPEDRFNIMKFSDRHSTFAQGFVHAEGDDLADAQRWVARLTDEGGTMILPALVAGMDLLGTSRWAGEQRIVFLTDGAIANETQVLDAVVQQLGDARLHTVGIGHAPNSWLMRKMAAHGHGLSTFISDIGGASNEIADFFRKIERPTLTDLQLEWDGAQPRDTFPARLPDLYAGEPLYVSFRLVPGEHPEAVTLQGYGRTGRLKHTTSLEALKGRREAAGLSVRWADAKVNALMDSLHEGADPNGVRGAVVDVALDFNLVTLYTSLVAVDHGQDDSLLTGLQQGAIALPQGGTDAGLRWLVGLALLTAGFAVVFLMSFFVRPS